MTNQTLDAVKALLDGGKYEEAQLQLKEYLKKDPNNPVAIRYYGNTFAYTGFLNKARHVWLSGLKKFSSDVDLLYNYAFANYLLGNLYSAKRFWKKALRLSPKDSEIYFNLGQIARDEGRLKKAVSYWKQSFKLKSDNVEVMNNIGVAYASLQLFGKAAVWYRRAIEADKNYALAHFNLATALYETKDYKNARAHAETAAKLDPETHMEAVSVLIKRLDEKAL